MCWSQEHPAQAEARRRAAENLSAQRPKQPRLADLMDELRHRITVGGGVGHLYEAELDRIIKELKE